MVSGIGAIIANITYLNWSPPTNINCIGIEIDSSRSNLSLPATIAANTIDFGNFDVANPQIQASDELKTITNLSNATTYINITVATGQIVTLVQANVTNIKGVPLLGISLNGTNGDFLECSTDGTNCYILAIHNF